MIEAFDYWEQDNIPQFLQSFHVRSLVRRLRKIGISNRLAVRKINLRTNLGRKRKPLQ